MGGRAMAVLVSLCGLLLVVVRLGTGGCPAECMRCDGALPPAACTRCAPAQRCTKARDREGEREEEQEAQTEKSAWTSKASLGDAGTLGTGGRGDGTSLAVLHRRAEALAAALRSSKGALAASRRSIDVALERQTLQAGAVGAQRQSHGRQAVGGEGLSTALEPQAHEKQAGAGGGQQQALERQAGTGRGPGHTAFVNPATRAHPSCNPQPHAGYSGGSLNWGMAFKVSSAQECCEACKAHATTCVPGAGGRVYLNRTWEGHTIAERCAKDMTSNELGTHAAQPCNVFVYCPTPHAEGGLCWSNDVWNHTAGECWLKHQAHPDRPHAGAYGAYPNAYRKKHRTAPPLVQWMSGSLHPGPITVDGPHWHW